MAERISFTRPSAVRIANVVRKVEQQRPQGAPLAFGREEFFKRPGVFRVCTYTGPWSIGASKTVTFKNQTATPNTASAINLFFPITSTATASRDCAIAKDGTAWYLIDVRLAEKTAVFSKTTAQFTCFGTASTHTISFLTATATAEVVVLGNVSVQSQQVEFLVDVNASFNTQSCSVGVSKAYNVVDVVTSVIAAEKTLLTVNTNATATAIAVSLSGTQTIAMISATFTASFLTLEGL